MTIETAPGLLDDLPLSAFQVWAVLMAAATVVLDGLDNQMLGLAAPSLIKEWGVAKESLGVVFAFGFVGMAFGTLTSGWMGDRFGRRGALIFGVAVFGIATLATGFATDLTQVGVLRTLAGVGLGGIPGTASAMIAEFTPPKWRSVAVTFGVVCVSIGGILGGVAAALILPELGWRWLFYLGGGISVLFVAVLHFLMPESPRYLAGRPERGPELTAMLRRIGHPDPANVHLPTLDRPTPAFVPMRALVGPALLRDTLALAVAMFSGMFMIYLMFNWAPTLLFSEGFTLATASSGLTSFNIGGTIGAMCASLAIIRFGSRGTLVVMALAGTAACVFLALLPISGARNEGALLAGLGALGLSASAAQSAMFAVGAHAFPTAVRARGLGLMGASGRIGAVLSALMGALLIGHGNLGFFGTLAVLMFVNAIGFVAVRGHIPRLVRQTAIPI
ncbi:MFS transporter [Sphingomonas naphthae]|uniref:MFS transporter n=1 Tax=Sphingomonas naphthae TaxID=1813468 RepID=A0ABY7TM66_9SPHN|nr:MFS transporter [Sphingomonas naphthae]WCT73782.1 MFS transporter [Sphingomonas naphthae]